MKKEELQKRLAILKKVSPWRFEVSGLRKEEIPLERVTGKKALEYFRGPAGYKSARIGPMVSFKGKKHYTIIVTIEEFFQKQDEKVRSWHKK